MHGEKVVHDAVYSTDGQRRRITPVEDGDERDNAILFFGCSVTYGMGVNDNETLPYYVGEFAPNFQPYNYAVGGWGPQQTLVLLRKKETVEKITQRSRIIGVFNYIDDHVLRVVGAKGMRWVRGFPRFVLREDGKLANIGTIEENPRKYCLLDRILEHSEAVRYMGVPLPLIRNRDIELTPLCQND